MWVCLSRRARSVITVDCSADSWKKSGADTSRCSIQAAPGRFGRCARMCTNRQADAGRVGVIVPPRGLGSPSSGPLRGPALFTPRAPCGGLGHTGTFRVDHRQPPTHRWAPCGGHLAQCGHTGHWWCPGNPKWGLGVDAREGRMTQPVAEAAGEQIGDASLGPIRGGDRLGRC